MLYSDKILLFSKKRKKIKSCHCASSILASKKMISAPHSKMSCVYFWVISDTCVSTNAAAADSLISQENWANKTAQHFSL